MKCTSNIIKTISILLVISLLTGCGTGIDIPYDLDSNNDAYLIRTSSQTSKNIDFFATNLCVSENELNTFSALINEAEAGGLFDATDVETIFAKNIHKQMNPASLTKVMTAYLALKYGHLDDILTASSNVLITESNATLMKLQPGDKISLREALYALLIYSANDAAVLIAEYLSGSVESFAAVMTDEARKIGATNSNFKNPHGLTTEGHYTTAYDLYLIFNAAMQYEEFCKIINTKEYTVSYKDSNGNSRSFEMENTNKYINGSVVMPEHVTVIGGKTGTTTAAGSCLIMLSKGTNEHTYISVVMHSKDRETLYKNMTEILNNVP